MNLHTPGPWKLETWPIGEHRTETRMVVARGDAVAKIEPLWIPSERVEEAEANAHLIAAAPDMLAALEELVAEHDRRNREFCEREGILQDGIEPIQPTAGILFARDAIAKAKGGAA